MTASVTDLVSVFEERGLLAQTTDEAIRERLSSPQTAYIGFDPTADSLHVGSLVPVMALAWLQRCGHRPLALVGGATALVGDPSGKTAMRQMLGPDEIKQNAAAIGQQIGRLVRFGDGPSDAALLNNADWLADKSWIDLLREVGPCFSVNRMLTMDSVKSRMDSGGISFLEFNYMVMQAYDFLHLYRAEACTVQLGGQDQWGNIVMGIELGRRLADVSLAGLTMPLITKADGSKFGKSEKGNVWLSAERTPPYEFFQFWRNVADADVKRFMAYFTFLPMEQITELTSVEGAALNEAKIVLAHEVTKLVHSEAIADEVRADAAKANSGGQDVTGASIPHADLSQAELADGIGLLILLVRAGLAKSNSNARQLVQGGGVRLHGDKITDPRLTVTIEHVQDDMLAFKVGKKLFRYDIVDGNSSESQDG